MKALKTSINCNPVDNCWLTLVLDKRTNKATDEYPMAVCFTIERKRYYLKLTNMAYQKEKYFNEVCSVTNSRSSLMTVYKEWQKILESYRDKLVKLSKNNTLSLELIKTYMTGAPMGKDNTTSFIGIWESILDQLSKEDRAGSAENYGWALKHFLKYAEPVEGFKIDINVIRKWDEIMKKGIVVGDKIEGKVEDATRGMYLRTCRVVWNECIHQGYLDKESYPFSNKDKTKISIPKGKRRQKSYLSVEEMTQLYNIFKEKKYPKKWNPKYTKRVHQSLGLFLVQYLCNGFNLADAGRLKYDRTYFAEGGKAFEFERKKTAARSNNKSVVVVPIIEPLQVILDEIAAKPEKDANVFPFILRGEKNETKCRRLTSDGNSNIQDRMIRLCKDVLGWDKKVSGTWARHSFATNLKLAGVEELYISESMAHSHGNDVTCGYQDMYPLEIRFRNNNKLLNIEPKEDTIDVDKLSEKEVRELLKKMLGKGGV